MYLCFFFFELIESQVEAESQTQLDHCHMFPVLSEALPHYSGIPS
jgi:hypothetical protein